MIEAARKYNRIVQVGFQNRSISNVMQAMAFLHNGGIGEVYMARGTCFKPRDSFGIAKDSNPPASLDYDLWLGPATWRPYNEKEVTTTGTGTGIPATAIPATRDRTSSTSPAGA